MGRNTSNIYKTFSGADSICYINFTGYKPIVFGQVTTVSYSLKRRVSPVELLGNNRVRGFTKGTRYVAGTIIFTLLNRHFVNELREYLDFICPNKHIKADELPLFDLIIIASNEYGAVSHMVIKDVTFADEGGVISVQDIITETQTSYFARDIRPFDHFDAMTGEPRIDSFDIGTACELSSNIGEPLSPKGAGTRVRDWFDFYGLKWDWNESKKTSTFWTRDGEKYTWRPGEIYPLPGVEIRPDGYFYVVNDAVLYKFVQGEWDNNPGNVANDYVWDKNSIGSSKPKKTDAELKKDIDVMMGKLDGKNKEIKSFFTLPTVSLWNMLNGIFTRDKVNQEIKNAPKPQQ